MRDESFLWLHLRILPSIAILWTIVFIPARADEATKQRFLREYPKASQELKKRFENVRCTIVRILPNDKGEIVSRFRKTGSFEKVEIDSSVERNGQKKDWSTVILKTPNYTTTLARRDEPHFVDAFERFSRQRPGAILDEIRKTKGIGSAWNAYRTRWSNAKWIESVNRSFRSECGQYVYAVWGGDAEAFLGLMRKPGFELLDASPDPDHPEIIEIRFLRDRSKQERESIVRLNSNNHWSVVSLRMPIQKTAQDAGFEIRFGDPIGDVALPTRIEFLNGISLTFKDWSFEKTPADEFQPSHYGLPDNGWDWFEPQVLFMLAAFAILTALITSFIMIRAMRNRFRKMRVLPHQEPHFSGESQ